MPALIPPRLHADRLRRPRLVLGLLLALAVPGSAGFAWAQEARPAHRHYQLSAGPLDEALNRFARLAGITLSSAPDMVQGRTAPALDADLAVEEALAQLLAGSGLRAVRTPGGGYGLQWQGPARSGNDAIPEQEQRLKQVVIVGRPDGLALHEGPPDYAATHARTGTRTDTPLLDIPQSLSVVTREEMDARGAASVMDALRYLPGANTQTHGVDPRGYDYFNLRGFINAQNTSNYLNGLRQLVAGFGMFRTESYALERVEVLRGAASATVGQADPGGVVNRISKLAGEGSPNELALSAGTFNMRQLAADLSGTIDEDGQAQARYLVRTLVSALAAGVAPNVWYSWKDAGTDPGNDQHHFGLLLPNGTPKPSYFALQTLLKELGAMRYACPVQRAGVEGAIFSGADGAKALVWAKAGTACNSSAPDRKSQWGFMQSLQISGRKRAERGKGAMLDRAL
jgi:iron complex outermembrane receptor protein